MRKIEIDSRIFDKFPETTIGIVVCKGFSNKEIGETENLLRLSEKNIMAKFTGTPLTELPEIATWRTAYKELGVKKGTRVSIESLAKRVIKGGNIPSINPIVNIYNAVSLDYIFPCGGEDLDCVKGDIHLTYALGNEAFQQIGSDEIELPLVDEIVYKDDEGCLCRRWNWREADRTKLTEETENAILVVESLTSSRKNEVFEALETLKKLCETHLSGHYTMHILTKDNTTVTL